MKIGITGGTGFLGQHLTKKLSEKHNIIILARDHFKSDRFFDLENIAATSLDDIDILIHCAAYLPKSFSDPSETTNCWINNALATYELIQKAEKSKIKSFIYISSGQIYDWSLLPVKEDWAINPMYRAVPYLMSKANGDCFVRHHALTSKMNISIVRPSSIYGNGMKTGGILPRLVQNLKITGNYNIDLVHVSDVADLIGLIINNNTSGVYNAGGGNWISTSKLIDVLSKIQNKFYTPEVLPIESGHAPLNIDKAREIGYNPRTLIDGLTSYVESL